MNATVTCEKCGKPLGIFDGNTCADCSKIEQIRTEIEHEGAMFPDGEFFVSIDRINEIIDKYKGNKE